MNVAQETLGFRRGSLSLPLSLLMSAFALLIPPASLTGAVHERSERRRSSRRRRTVDALRQGRLHLHVVLLVPPTSCGSAWSVPAVRESAEREVSPIAGRIVTRAEKIDTKAYYIRIDLATGFWKGHGRLTLVQPEQGASEFKQGKSADKDMIKDNTLLAAEFVPE